MVAFILETCVDSTTDSCIHIAGPKRKTKEGQRPTETDRPSTQKREG